MREPPVGSVVHVTWVDSIREAAWNTADNMLGVEGVCESVGWLVRALPWGITVSGHKSLTTSEWCGSITIPRDAVRTIRIIKLTPGQ